MEHRGEIIKKAVYKSGYPITELAKRLRKSRRWMYLMFDNNNVSLDLVIQIGKIIYHDFSEEIKDLTPYQNVINESPSDYIKKESQAEYWKNKYLELLEEYNEILKKMK